MAVHLIDIDLHGGQWATTQLRYNDSNSVLYYKNVAGDSIWLAKFGSNSSITYYAGDAAGNAASEWNASGDYPLLIPSRDGYVFRGFWQNADGGNQYVDSGGKISASYDLPQYVTSARRTLHARWNQSNKITLFIGSGRRGTSALHFLRVSSTTTRWYGKAFFDSACRTSAAVGGYVAVPRRGGYVFQGFYTASTGGTQVINSTGKVLSGLTTLIQEATGNFTLYAHWRYDSSYNFFGDVEDYFGLDDLRWANTGLSAVGSYRSGIPVVAVSSSLGAGVPRQCVRNCSAGRTATATATGCEWVNPSVTYEILADTTVIVNLGESWDAVTSFGAMTRSGYMITSVEVSTAAGQRPTITVRATANEGRPAINIFPVSIAVSARSKAQILMNGVSLIDGAKLTACKVVATCDPVVLAENLRPVASDVVNGRLELSAEGLQLSEGASLAAAGGFERTGGDVDGGESSFRVIKLTAVKEIG